MGVCAHTCVCACACMCACVSVRINAHDCLQGFITIWLQMDLKNRDVLCVGEGLKRVALFSRWSLRLHDKYSIDIVRGSSVNMLGLVNECESSECPQCTELCLHACACIHV